MSQSYISSLHKIISDIVFIVISNYYIIYIIYYRLRVHTAGSTR